MICTPQHYYWGDKIEKNEMGVGVGNAARMEERRDAYLLLVDKPEGKRLLGRPCCKREDNIKKDILEVEWGHGLIDLAQDREKWLALVNAVKNLRFP